MQLAWYQIHDPLTLQWLLDSGRVTLPDLDNPMAFSPYQPLTSSGQTPLTEPAKGRLSRIPKSTSRPTSGGMSKTPPSVTIHPTTRPSRTRTLPAVKQRPATRSVTTPRPLPLPTSTARASPARASSARASTSRPTPTRNLRSVTPARQSVATFHPRPLPLRTSTARASPARAYSGRASISRETSGSCCSQKTPGCIIRPKNISTTKRSHTKRDAGNRTSVSPSLSTISEKPEEDTPSTSSNSQSLTGSQEETPSTSSTSLMGSKTTEGKGDVLELEQVKEELEEEKEEHFLMAQEDLFSNSSEEEFFDSKCTSD